jgi:hypothetical protein
MAQAACTVSDSDTCFCEHRASHAMVALRDDVVIAEPPRAFATAGSPAMSRSEELIALEVSFRRQYDLLP